MTGLLQTLRWLAVVVWVGGIVFFAFVVAPVAFRGLPSTHEAGIVVRGTIHALHTIGMACGLIIMLATLALLRRKRAARPRGGPDRRQKFRVSEIGLAVLMFGVTALSEIDVIGPMERDRVEAGGVIEAIPQADPLRADFERRHAWSERLEGFVLLCGLGLVVAMACEPNELDPGRA